MVCRPGFTQPPFASSDGDGRSDTLIDTHVGVSVEEVTCRRRRGARARNARGRGKLVYTSNQSRVPSLSVPSTRCNFVHFKAKREHFLWDTGVEHPALTTQMAQVELKSGQSVSVQQSASFLSRSVVMAPSECTHFAARRCSTRRREDAFARLVISAAARRESRTAASPIPTPTGSEKANSKGSQGGTCGG